MLLLLGLSTLRGKTTFPSFSPQHQAQHQSHLFNCLLICSPYYKKKKNIFEAFTEKQTAEEIGITGASGWENKDGSGWDTGWRSRVPSGYPTQALRPLPFPAATLRPLVTNEQFRIKKLTQVPPRKSCCQRVKPLSRGWPQQWPRASEPRGPDRRPFRVCRLRTGWSEPPWSRHLPAAEAPWVHPGPQPDPARRGSLPTVSARSWPCPRPLSHVSRTPAPRTHHLCS